jgi:hypothetical protein
MQLALPEHLLRLLDADDLVHELAGGTLVTAREGVELTAAIGAATETARARRRVRSVGPRSQTPGIRQYWSADVAAAPLTPRR